MTDSPAEQAVAAYFHFARDRPKPSPGVEKIAAAMRLRSAMLAAEESHMDKPLSEMTDLELVALYNSLECDDPEIDRVANEMGERGIDF